MLMTGPTRPMRHPGVLITCNNAHKSTILCYINTLHDEQTQSRQLESNLVRPFIQNFSLETRDAAGCKPWYSAVKQEGQNRLSIGSHEDWDETNWSAIPITDETLGIMIGQLCVRWAGEIGFSVHLFA